MLNFKTQELRQEFYQSTEKEIDPRLKAVILYFAYYVWEKYAQELIITQLSRTGDEQIKIYGDSRPSPHTCKPCRAVDFRSLNFIEPQIEQLKEHFFKHFAVESFDLSQFKYHMGTTWHIHIHVPKIKMLKEV